MKIFWMIFWVICKMILTLAVLSIPIIEKTGGINFKKFWDSNQLYMIVVIVVVCLSLIWDGYNGYNDIKKSQENEVFQSDIKSQSLEISNLKGQNTQLILSNETLRKMILLNSEVDNKIRNVSFSIKLRKPFDENLNNYYFVLWVDCADYKELSLRQFIRLGFGKTNNGEITPAIQLTDLNTPEGENLRICNSFDLQIAPHQLDCRFLVIHNNLKMRDYNNSKINFYTCPGFIEKIESIYFIVNNYVVFSKNITSLPNSEINIKNIPSWNNYPLTDTVFMKFNDDPDWNTYWKDWRIDLFSNPLQRFN